MLSTTEHPRKFLRDYPYWLPPPLVALILTLVYLNPFIGDWDGLDYTIFSLHGRPSSMALGRALFTLSNFVFYKVAHALFGFYPPPHAPAFLVLCGAGNGGTA